MSLVPAGKACTAFSRIGTASAYLPCWIRLKPWLLRAAPLVPLVPDGAGDGCVGGEAGGGAGAGAAAFGLLFCFFGFLPAFAASCFFAGDDEPPPLKAMTAAAAAARASRSAAIGRNRVRR